MATEHNVRFPPKAAISGASVFDPLRSLESVDIARTMDALPPPPPAIVVQRAEDSAPLVLLGFMAVGQEDDMRALERAASSLGFESGRTVNDRNEPEIMVLFRPGSSRAQSLKLYSDARAGQFGPLRLEVIIIPVSAAADGIDFDREVSAEPPAYIADPNH